LAAGDVACLQLRLKEASDNQIGEAARTLMPIAHKYDVAFIINDRPDLTRDLGADGVHVGQEDATYSQAREIVGDDKIVGVTCHASRHLAMVAGEDGADYVAFGAFFPTTTKTPKSEASPEILTWWGELFEVPSVAIGGLTVENCETVIKARTDFIAVSAGVWSHKAGPGAAVREFNQKLSQSTE
jgi:thiamine-phosphate pyrophosphorylase